MIKITDLFSQTKRLVQHNSPGLLTAIGITGTISTAYFASVATWRAKDILEQEDFWFEQPSSKEAERDRYKLIAKHTWRLYIPTAVSGTTTVFAILGANRIGSRRTAAAVAAYSMSDRAFEEYRAKVAEIHGENKERAIRDAVAQDRVEETPAATIVLSGSTKVMCCELYTGRIFESDMETLRKAQNDLNRQLLRDDYATLDDLYFLLGLQHTTNSAELGWISERQLELEFTSTLKDGMPCLAFGYNYVKPVR